jgi:hypothetical protein
MNFDPGNVNAITDVKQSIFNVYPNPSNGVFTIELDATAKYDVTITNVLGQTVYTTPEIRAGSKFIRTIGAEVI